MAQVARKTKTSKSKTSRTKILKSKKKSKLPSRKPAKTSVAKKAVKATKTLTKATAKKGRPAKKTASKPAKKVTKKWAATGTKKSLTARSAKKWLKREEPSVSIVSQTATPLELVTNETTPAVARVAAGDLAPDFSLVSTTGETVTLSQYRGKKVVLYFYPKDDTPGCTKESCNFRDQLNDFTAQDAVILGVSFDDQESHQRFTTKYQLNFPLLSDVTKSTAQAYGVYVQKNMYGNVSWGIERSTFIIDRDGVIASAIRKVSVDGHTEEVLNTLKALP